MRILLPKVTNFLSSRMNSSASFGLLAESDRRSFNNVFHVIVSDLTVGKREIPEYYHRLRRLLKYTVPQGKLVGGLTTVMAFKMFSKPENLTPKNIELASILGWCVEMLQGGLHISDDIIGRSETRSGSLCWYKHPDVGLSGINDISILEHLVYQLLKIYFSQHQCYFPIMELIHETTLKTSVGLVLEKCTTDLDIFTMSRYQNIVKYKTSFYTFLLPTTAAMHLAQCYNHDLSNELEEGARALGNLYQLETDFVDCFGDPDSTGKVGNDIREGRCTWLIAVALQNSDNAQRKILKENYGRPEDEAVKKVQNVYEELDIPRIYTKYRQNVLKDNEAQIRKINSPIVRTFFLELMKVLFNERTF